ncbi:MAG TPA: hypothetical protein VFQ90_00765 [Stellaceae bacterium]|jgi:hypothetical protein|nr:hypothetical protein [Stellaceae bacterium]
MKRKITFHIGFEKTGCYSFQMFCTKHATLLRRYSVVYPVRSLAFGDRNHAPLAACYLDYDDFSIRSSGRPRTEVLRTLLAEIGETGDSDILISAEHFSSRFKEREIGQLATDFAEFDCRIAVVVREHRARLFSAYGQSVRSGRAMTLAAYCDEVLHPSNWYMHYATTIGAWEDVFGRQNVTVLCYLPDRDVVPVLCNALIASDPALLALDSCRENRSIGPSATEWLRRANSLIRRMPKSALPAFQTALGLPRRGFVCLARKLDRDAQGWQLSEQNLQRLNEIAAADNDWLQSRYGVRLPSVEQSGLASPA